MINFPSLADHSLIWIFGIVLPFLSGSQSEKLRGSIQFDASSRKKLYLGNSFMLAISGSSVLVLWLIKDRSFSELGFTKSIEITPMVWGIISLFVIAYLLDLFITLKELNKSNGTKEKDWFETIETVDVKNSHLINIYRPIGANTIGSTHKAAIYDIRGLDKAVCPKFVVSPWLQSSYEPDRSSKGICS
jgi:hypothetical protein